MKKESQFPQGKYSFGWFLLRRINLLSLDVVAGAVLSGAFAAILSGFQPAITSWFVLGLSVWIFYTLDHLVDAYRLGRAAHTPRHLFVHRNFRVLAAIVLVLSLIDLLLVLFLLDTRVLLFGLALGGAGGIYFLLVHLAGRRSYILLKKEVIVSLIYTAGIWGMPLIQAGHEITAMQLLLPSGFLLLAFMNILLLSYHDHGPDELDGHPTIAVVYGRKRAMQAALVTGVTVILFSSFAFILPFESVLKAGPLIYFLMAGSMICLLLASGRVKNKVFFRLLTELVFWLPGLALLI